MSASELHNMFKAMSAMVNSVWVDPESKRNLAKMQKNGVFFQQPEEGETVEVDAQQMADMTAQNEQNLAAFESLKGKAEEALQRMRDEETKTQHEHNMNMAALKQ